ncbi:MAG: hypothetical protein IT158_17925 [Bryobacterales bacterium]|nr:hypothetical protein [Bryobacterales bacterium]
MPSRTGIHRIFSIFNSTAVRRLTIFAVWPAVAACAFGAVRVWETGQYWAMENPDLRVTIDRSGAAVTVMDKAGRITWKETPSPARTSFAGARSLEGGGGLSFETAFTAPDGRPYPMTLKVTLPARGADLRVEADMADRGTKFETLPFLGPFVLDSPDAAIVVADSGNGHLYPADLNPLPRRRLSLGSIDMPWIGVCDIKKGQGYAIMAETPDDGFFELLPHERGSRTVWAPRVTWAPSMRTLRYPRRLLYHFSPRGGYVALAKRYRALAREQGLIVPFTEKLKKNPNIARAFGAPDVWGNASLEFARAAKAAGVEKMLIHGVSPAAEMRAINDLGYLTSKYDIYQDVMPVKDESEIDIRREWVPENVVLKADGTRMTAWLTWDKKQFMKRCPRFWLRTARLLIPKDLAQRPYLGRFIDVTTAEGLYECYDPNHPMSNTEKRELGVELLAYVRSLGLVTGGEHGRWWAVPQLDYIEGMMSGGSTSWPSGHLKRPKSKDEPFITPSGSPYPKWADYEKWGIGHQYRVPLWELVFHDCIISTWYWGDSSDFLIEAAPEVTATKDAFNILYGTMPMMWANQEGSWVKAREVFLRTYRNTSRMHEAVAAAEMLSHEFLTPDRAVQRTRFSDGTEAVVNFGRQPYRVTVGGRSRLLPQNGFAVKGPRIEQSMELVNGKAVTTVRTPD